ncbi:MAG: hypothetical protein GXO69_02615 [Acidobacteria bacterium]|nr:hypothetical protein [Acidobacteriota bacterium]
MIDTAVAAGFREELPGSVVEIAWTFGYGRKILTEEPAAHGIFKRFGGGSVPELRKNFRIIVEGK